MRSHTRIHTCDIESVYPWWCCFLF
jgi:hypothetical protein